MAMPSDSDQRNQLNEHIIKQLYYVAYLKGSKLPKSLGRHSSQTKAGVSVNGCTAAFNRASSQETLAPVVLRTDNPIPVCCSVYYFEVTVNVKSRSGSLTVGLCSSRSSLAEWPGMEANSYGYHSNNGAIYHGSKELNTTTGPTYGEADVIGCGVNFVTNSVFFTKNGVFMGPITTGKKLPHPVYPCIALACAKCHVSANFGQHKFTFDIGQYIARERAVVISTAVDRKCNDQLAHVTMRNLVAAYLLHNGYLESASALGGWASKATVNSESQWSNTLSSTNGSAGQVKESAKGDSAGTVTTPPDNLVQTPASCLSSPSVNPFRLAEGDSSAGLKAPLDQNCEELLQWPEPTELLLRRRQLRDTIRAGDYFTALDLLQTHFPRLSEKDPSIGFVLRCHHFINLMCRSSEAPSFPGYKIPTANHLGGQTCHLPRSGPKPTVGIDSPRTGAQKRPKPSSSLESSPETGTNGHADTNGFVSSQPAAHFAPNSSHSNNNHHHDHSPSSCQAPIRLRLNTPESADRPHSLSDTAQLLVYPSHHHCYKDEPLRCSSNNSISPCTLTESLQDQRENGVHHISDGHKRERRVTSGVCLPVCAQTEWERGLEGVGAAVGLLDLTEQAYGNSIGRRKSLVVAHRGKSALSPISLSPPCSIGASANALFPDSLPFPDTKSSNCSDRKRNSSDRQIANRSSVVESVGNGHNGHHLANSSIPNGDAHAPSDDLSLAPCESQGCSGSETILQSADSDTHCPSSLSNQNLTAADVLYLVEYGRTLRSLALELQHRDVITPTQIQLLNGAFGLIAYQDPFTSPFRRFLDPVHRERLADAVNSAIMVHFNQPATPVLDSALAFMESALADDGNGHLSANLDPPLCEQTSDHFRSSIDLPADSRTDTFSDTTVTHMRRSSDPLAQPLRTSTVSFSYSRASPARTAGPLQAARIRPLLTDTQSAGVVDTSDDVANGSNQFSRSTGTSVVSTSIYIAPSALVSVGSRSDPQATNRSSSASNASAFLRPTSLITRISTRDTQLGPSHSPSLLTPSTPVTSTVLGWSAQEPNESTRGAPRNIVPTSSSRLPVTSYVTNTHAPTGPELAGFFHPVLFID
ncbi:hypothetical protein P879_01051 [Paragonimus westermani]|uniref:Uncharacterized protein n=1 Tax=Paragonimus westermani TaxID=34504 RepID=A0A8T0DVV6_9TREM|nr:hypothetical protein P879_01051 [Paragonimus westermani]